MRKKPPRARVGAGAANGFTAGQELLLGGGIGRVVSLRVFGGIFFRGDCGGRAVAGGLDEEELGHAEGAAGGFGSGAVVHEGEAFLGYFAEEDFPGTADEFFLIDLRGGLGLLGLLGVFAVAVAVAAALAAVAGAAFAAAHGFGHGKAGGRGELGGGIRVFDIGGALLLLLGNFFGGFISRGILPGGLRFFGLAVGIRDWNM